jgi:hypothetical protein
MSNNFFIIYIFFLLSPSAYPIGEIGSGYPSNVYDGNRLSLPILRQKLEQSCGMIFIDLPDSCWYLDRNTWNTLLISEQKIILNNWTTNNRMKQSEQNRNRIKSNQAELKEFEFEITGKMTNNNWLITDDKTGNK